MKAKFDFISDITMITSTHIEWISLGLRRHLTLSGWSIPDYAAR